MKKIYALILAMLLVFAVAGVSSAAINVAISGSASVDATYDLDTGNWDWAVNDASTFVDLAFSGTFGEHATASMLLSIAYPGNLVFMETFNYTYKFSDSFAMGVVYDNITPGIMAYEDPVMGWSYWVPSTPEALFAEFTLGAVKGILYTNGEFTAPWPADFGLAGKITADLGMTTLTAGFSFDSGWDWGVGADAAFKITDNWTVTVAGGYEYMPVFNDTDWEVGGKAAYASDAFNADVWVTYYQDIDGGILDWYDLEMGGSISAEVVPDMVTLAAGVSFDIDDVWVEGYYVKADVIFTENISAFALYQVGQLYSTDYNDGFYIEGDFKIDTVNTLAIWYGTAANDIGINFTVNFA